MAKEEKDKIKAHRSKIKSESEVTEKINKFVELLKQQGVNISKIILFGSYAKGRAIPDDLSDKYSSFSQEIKRYGIDVAIKGT